MAGLARTGGPAAALRRRILCRVPSQEEIDRFIRHNETARKADLEADRQLTMSERLEQAAELSQALTELRDNFQRLHGPSGR